MPIHDMLPLRHFQSLVVCLAVLCLAGCAPSGTLKEGSTRDEVRASWGKPTLAKPRATGERWVFATAPEGRQTWFVDFDASGRMTAFDQVLTQDHVQRVQPGQTQPEVEDLIGPSYYTMRYPLQPNELAHIYRFVRPNAPICFYVYYGPEGKVLRTDYRDDRVYNALERPC